MAEIEMPHQGHEEHLCLLQNVGYVSDNVEDYKRLVRNPNYVCRACGRAAVDKNNLCAPEKL